jgi:3-hydroxyisobutyrate dehydrogenase-like beta-hydroxyacid dehydrogenase
VKSISALTDFAVALIRKDLGLAMDAAKSVNADMDFTEHAFKCY